MGEENDDKTRTEKPRIFFADMVESARRGLYNLGYSIASRKIDDLLKPLSLMPTIVGGKFLMIILS